MKAVGYVRVSTEEQAAHGISLRDDIINDRHRSLLDGLDVVAPRMTETTARLRRALDDVDQIIAQQRVTRSQRRVKTVL